MDKPSDEQIAKVASELNLIFVAQCDRLARALLSESGAADFASPEQVSELELTKLRIRHRANVADLSAAVAAARIAGATWAQVGQAVGSSRQAAFERWNKAVKAYENATREGDQIAEDVLDKYDPFGMKLSPTVAQFLSVDRDSAVDRD
ncbi:hypothetical protein [Nocardia sp. NPDC050718]|uniref:hypothetical protein n=1 Tax=Nocardia sp. NPDC050718 TaxID=3155788 RepID=UPI0033C579CB